MKRYILFWVSLVLMLASLFLVFVYVPTEKEMGIVQRIFYLMVPMGWLALLSFFIVFICSILYLARRRDSYDALAYSSAEVGIFATTGALIVGCLWAKPIWGVWWTWEPRLTATLVLWFIYFAYFAVRSFAGEEARGARYAAVIGIVGFVDLPIVALATTLWRGMHPGGVIFSGGLAPSMLLTLLVSLGAYTVLYVLLLVHRTSVRQDEAFINSLKARLG
ncbi:MAG TPA: cytochrome c biogenesis protein CcsA [Dehalococcoidales bacterium]|nr:MAG: cytochrome C assembly protein [Chloroflexi bacterium RBG_16_60_22]HJX13868.1 cytochrome c biogenesis protein CcsA [Dehalococcoidales bacterium]